MHSLLRSSSPLPSLRRRLSTMRSVEVLAYGGPAALHLRSDAPLPAAGTGEVVVRNALAGLNFIDTYQRSGLYKAASLPFTPGVEGAGELHALGAGVDAAWFPSRNVAYFCAGGAYAEFVKVPASNVVCYPETMSPQTAAACMIQGLTAHYLATDTWALREGQVALVHAAAGGTGQMLVQMAKIRGAKVIGTSSKAKMAIGYEAGADIMLPYDEMTKDEIIDRIRQETAGKGADVAYDGVGKATYEISLGCLRKRGLCVLYGNASGPVPPIDPLTLNARGSLFLTRPKLYDYIETREDLVSRAREIFDWIEQGKLKVSIQKEFALEDIAEAHKFIENGNTTGKVVIRI